MIGISAGALSFIPYVGSLTTLVLSSVVAIVQGWPDWRLLAISLIIILVGQFLEGNILSPKFVGESAGLHPVWLIFALLAFGSLFGFTGLITAVPFAAAAGVILRFAVKRYRESDLYTSRLIKTWPSLRPYLSTGTGVLKSTSTLLWADQSATSPRSVPLSLYVHFPALTT